MAGAYEPNGINREGQIYFYQFLGRIRQRWRPRSRWPDCVLMDKKAWNKKLGTDVAVHEKGKETKAYLCWCAYYE